MTESPVCCQPVATWFRYCLLITAIFNLFGAISFAPPVYDSMVDTLGFPKYASPFILWVIASWIFLFGVGYVWLSVIAKPEKLFVAVAAACKIAIAIFFFIFVLTGDLPLIVIFPGCADLLFGIIFIFWLFQTQKKIQ